MASKNTAVEEAEKVISDAAAATRAEIANRPRQSVVRKVQYVAILDVTEPGKADELIEPSELAAIREVVGQVENPVVTAREKSDQAQHDLAVKALLNEDEKNGYANFPFSAEAFAEKTKEKTARVRKTVSDKLSNVKAEDVSDEDLAALQALIAQAEARRAAAAV